MKANRQLLDLELGVGLGRLGAVGDQSPTPLGHDEIDESFLKDRRRERKDAPLS